MGLFVEQELQEFEVDGVVFRYRLPTAKDESEWYKDYTFREKEKREDPISKEMIEFEVVKIDTMLRNWCFMRNIEHASFDVVDIERLIKQKKQYHELSKAEQNDLLGKLDPEVWQKIVSKIGDLVKPPEKEKKN